MSMMIDPSRWSHAEKVGACEYQLFNLSDCEVCGCAGKSGDAVNVKGVTKIALRAAGLTVAKPGDYVDLGCCDALGGIVTCCGCYRDEEQVREEQPEPEPEPEVVEKPRKIVKYVLGNVTGKLLIIGTLTYVDHSLGERRSKGWQFASRGWSYSSRKRHDTEAKALAPIKRRFGKLTIVDTEEEATAAIAHWVQEQMDIANPEEAFKPEPEVEDIQPLDLESERTPEPSSAMPRHTRREDWLHEAVPYLRELILTRAPDGAPMIDQDRPEPYLSVGWPKRSRGKAARVGECWSAQHESGRAHIFVSPELADAVRVLDVLVHELIHDYVGLECGHRGAFAQVAKGVGLEGKMTATIAGDALRLELERIALLCGPYPHEALTQEPRATPKQRCRQRKYTCPECGQIIRAATDDLQAICYACSHKGPVGEIVEPLWFVLDGGEQPTEEG